MDGQFIVFFLALGVPLVFGACIGAAFRGRFGRGLGLVTLALGLAGLLYGALTFTTYRDGYGLFAGVLQILMAGGVFVLAVRAGWRRAGRGREWKKRRGTGGNAEQPAGCSLFSRPPQLSP
ncbi:MAG: hypothetical protein ACLU6O_09065 [Bilophila wadsworthia]